MTSTKSLVDLIAQAGPMVSVREHPIKPVACKGRHIKRVGSGVRRVIDTFVAYGLPEPEFEATQGGMAVTVFRNVNTTTAPRQPDSQGVSGGAVAEMSGKMSDKVFSSLRDEPTTTIAQLAHQFGVSTRTIDRALKQLQQDNRVMRSGHARGSQWKVLDLK